MNQIRQRGGWLRVLSVSCLVILALPVVAIVSMFGLFTFGPAVGWLIDPGFDGETPLLHNYGLWRLKGYPRFIAHQGTSYSGAYVPAGNASTTGNWTTEVGRISTGSRYIVGEITQYSLTASGLGPVVGWFIVDTAAHTSTEYSNQQMWEGELVTRGIDPKTLELVEFP